MSHVNVSIDGRQYRMACDEGQEAHLQSLAEDLDKRINELRENFGDIGDSRALIVMAALTISDELSENVSKLQHAEQEASVAKEVRAVATERARTTQAAVVAALDAASERIERVTKSLNQSLGDTVPMG
jgi:cell division protein ZapA